MADTTDTTKAPSVTITDGNITDQSALLTEDGFRVSVSLTSRQEDGSYGRLRTDGFAARYVGNGRYWTELSHGKTVEEALAKARKAHARLTAQRAEDKEIENRYRAAAYGLANGASLLWPRGHVPESLTAGQAVYFWAHGRVRHGIVGSVSKTGARARIIYVTPSGEGTVHISTYSRKDLVEAGD